MTDTTANQIVRTIEAAERVWSANDHLINDPRIDDLVQQSMEAAGPADGMRWFYALDVDPLSPHGVTPYLEHRKVGVCILCGSTSSDPSMLIVNAGTLLVVLHACDTCRDELDRDYSPITWA